MFDCLVKTYNICMRDLQMDKCIQLLHSRRKRHCMHIFQTLSQYDKMAPDVITVFLLL